MINKYSKEFKEETHPFETVEDAWFWFIDANEARNDGARIMAGAGLYIRPCEANDILNILNRLHRNRRLLMDHLRVLRFYGLKGMSPDPYTRREISASKLWDEAMDILEEIFISKGIVEKPTSYNNMPEAIWCNHDVANGNGGYIYA